jgi:hypothetical protein
MALVQETNSVRFIGMTSVDLNGNRIIGRQSNGAEVSVPANNQTLVSLSEKLNIRVASMTKIDATDQEIISKYKNIRDTQYAVELSEFLEFYLSANRAGMSPLEMYAHLGYAASNPSKKSYILDKILSIKLLAKRHGFELPEIKNDGNEKKEDFQTFLKGLNWSK